MQECSRVISRIGDEGSGTSGDEACEATRIIGVVSHPERGFSVSGAAVVLCNEVVNKEKADYLRPQTSSPHFNFISAIHHPLDSSLSLTHCEWLF